MTTASRKAQDQLRGAAFSMQLTNPHSFDLTQNISMLSNLLAATSL